MKGTYVKLNNRDAINCNLEKRPWLNLLKSFDKPDDALAFPKTKIETVKRKKFTIFCMLAQSGGRWSESLSGLMETDTCQFKHRVRSPASLGRSAQSGFKPEPQASFLPHTSADAHPSLFTGQGEFIKNHHSLNKDTMNFSNHEHSKSMKHKPAADAGPTMAAGIEAGKKPDKAYKESNASSNPMAGYYNFSLGDLKINVVNDGYFHLSHIAPPDMEVLNTLAMNVEDETRQEYFRSHLFHSGDIRLLVSPILIESEDRRILVDSGWSGSGATPTSGRLASSLALLGIEPETIDTIILTHAHPDHLGGLLNPDSRALTYPNAEIIISQTEFEFWKGDEAKPVLDTIPLLAEIPEVLQAIDENLRLVKVGDELVSGIQSIPSPGHTPGHISLGIEAGGNQLLLTGDAITNIHTNFERPDWLNFFDLDQEQAANTRRQLLDRAATDEMLILGYHLPFPGLGYAVSNGQSYNWYPAGMTLLP